MSDIQYLHGRKLATVRVIKELQPIHGADKIEIAVIDGWRCIVEKHAHSVGDKVIYIEIDSFLDVADPRFQFLEKRGTKVDYRGDRGHVLKTIRLRGELSQGLVLSMYDVYDDDEDIVDVSVGDDVTGDLNIGLFEPPFNLPGVGGGGTAPGDPFPFWIRKTNQERVQNAFACMNDGKNSHSWVATEKIDGSSMTVYYDAAKTKIGVCSHHRDLHEADGGPFWAMAKELRLDDRLVDHVGLFGSAVIQGEMFGEGIQGNPLRMRGRHFRAFSFFSNGDEVWRASWPQWVYDLSVPVYEGKNYLPFPTGMDGVKQALDQVYKLRSLLGPEYEAEGVVWHNLIDLRSFKAINDNYLLKHDL